MNIHPFLLLVLILVTIIASGFLMKKGLENNWSIRSNIAFVLFLVSSSTLMYFIVLFVLTLLGILGDAPNLAFSGISFLVPILVLGLIMRNLNLGKKYYSHLGFKTIAFVGVALILIEILKTILHWE